MRVKTGFDQSQFRKKTYFEVKVTPMKNNSDTYMFLLKNISTLKELE